MYVVVSIGNSDDKLSQKEWSQFVEDAAEAISKAGKVHFAGGSSTFAPWQNVAWIAEVQPKDVDNLGDEIRRIRERYKQDSAFVMIGEGLFI
jgi:predicted phage gp36 major capsid-like protein